MGVLECPEMPEAAARRMYRARRARGTFRQEISHGLGAQMAGFRV